MTIIATDVGEVLAHPVPCAAPRANSSWVGEWCRAKAWGPTPEDPRCPDHGGPDPRLCDTCDRPEQPDGDPLVDCLNVGPVHAGECHRTRCDSRACRDHLGSGDDVWLGE